MTSNSKRLTFVLGLFFAASALVAMGPPPSQDDDGLPPDRKQLVIGLDLSKTNPLAKDEAFAGRAANRVAELVSNLPMGSLVKLRTFGAYKSAQNPLEFDTRLSLEYTPAQLAGEVQLLIASVPKRLESGEWRGQIRTNILTFLSDMNRVTDCADSPTTYLLVSDGIEDSKLANLSRAGTDRDRLPAPDPEEFKGCAELQILGLGQGVKDPRRTDELREKWQAWSDAAGIDAFVGLHTW